MESIALKPKLLVVSNTIEDFEAAKTKVNTNEEDMLSLVIAVTDVKYYSSLIS